jgi:hypothetical protein
MILFERRVADVRRRFMYRIVMVSGLPFSCFYCLFQRQKYDTGMKILEYHSMGHFFPLLLYQYSIFNWDYLPDKQENIKNF